MRKALYILGELAEEDIVFLASAGKVNDFADGDILLESGRSVDALYFITEGGFDVVVASGDVVASLDVGDVIGEMSFIEKQPPSVNVVARGASRVLAVPRDALLSALDERPQFSARFYKALATFLSDRLRTTTAKAMGDVQGQQTIDEHLLDVMHIAGDRMLRLIEMLEGRDR